MHAKKKKKKGTVSSFMSLNLVSEVAVSGASSHLYGSLARLKRSNLHSLHAAQLEVAGQFFF